ncbi:hypothetical protein WICMUC_000620 [Wickerhamomyces mucosus]|uniref:Zn(2)-C6 fungal-type domain-containing protein n=1 Tax=Wickerhamomyces mucosus TaxID=1378264 RepID=A0A9P8PWP4_9ASCO|nr:hypothetical protein WICMUC_000620 [Wickerhamomyces mucosus]
MSTEDRIESTSKKRSKLENGTPKKKLRSRFGCHRCKRLKVKCDELKPSCTLCLKTGSSCDYSIKLTWGGRPFKDEKKSNMGFGTISSFDMKYNPEKSNTHKTQNTAKTLLESIPLTPCASGIPEKIQLMTPEVYSAASITRSTTIDSDRESTSFINESHIIPSKFHILQQPEPKIEEIFQPLDIDQQFTIPSTLIQSSTERLLNTPTYDNFATAFKDLETSNSLAKEFVNQVLLPDLTSFGSNHESNLGDIQSFNSTDVLSEPGLLFEDLTFNSIFFTNTDSPSTSDNDNLFRSIDQVISNEMKDYLYIIPPFIEPIPDLLLQNSKYREYYHYYINIFSKTLVPANPNSYKENPFTCLLPRISMISGTDGLLSGLIAMGVIQTYSCKNTTPSSFPKELISDLLSRVLKDLYQRLTDPKESQSDYTLALILVMTGLDIIRGPRYGWRNHYLGARKIVMSRGFLKAVSERQHPETAKGVSFELADESDLVFFFSRWFAYLDVFGLLAASSDTFTNSPSRNLILWQGPKISKTGRENLKDIDPLMGFDFKILDFFGEIISLIDEREKLCKTPDKLSIGLIQRSLDVKDRLLRYMEETESERDKIRFKIEQDTIDARNSQLDDYEILRATNSVIAFAGVLQIYRRILMMSTQSNIVQEVVVQITEIIRERIPETATAANCTMFSLFSCGCEAVDQETRDFYVERMKILIETGSVGSRDAYNVMVESWETGRFWADILSEKGIDLMFA